mmetsp:Transcript_1698/g.3754  ORF Transcript_1698/g.3754 Transcript_1698/m.3754 type:complete len:1166 (+) Transcript_1698:259-3756(+)
MWHSGEQDAQQTPLSTYSTDDPTQQQQMHLPLYAQPHHHLAQQPTTAGMFSFSTGQFTASTFPSNPTAHTARTNRSSWRSGGPPTGVAPPANLQQQQQTRLPPRYFHHQQQQLQQQQFHHPFAAPILLQAPPYGLTAVPTRSSLGATTAAASGIAPPPRPMSSPLAYGHTVGWGGMQLGGRPQGRSTGQTGGGPRRGLGQGRGFDEGRASQHADVVILHIINAIRSLPPHTPCFDTAVASGLGTLDSRSAAVFIKQLAQANMVNRAWELFNSLRALQAAGKTSELLSLLDVYSYTAMISLCSNNREVALAQELSQEMVALGIQRNVHTFSALMNVAIKASQYQLALDIFEEMQAAGCQPNLVTFNTLIDVYGKLNKWTEAVRVVNNMRAMGIEPVIRTYNTLMIACNSSNQWQESLRVYQQLVESGLRPNTTTFNALIAAYSKSGNLDKVMEVYQQMVRSGCERSVITYSTLISACEKAGEWELALQLFGRMPEDGVRPNTITFNSLITACAQGSQWDRAEEVFEQMGRLSCQPDVVSYTALITAYGRGAQWRRALDAFKRMQRARCAPDHVVYEAVIEVLWETGVGVAQRCAVSLYRASVLQGLARQQQQQLSGGMLRPSDVARSEPSLDIGPGRFLTASQYVDASSSGSGSAATRTLLGATAISLNMGQGQGGSMGSASQVGHSSTPSGDGSTSEGRSCSPLVDPSSSSGASSQPPGQQQQQQQRGGEAAELLLGASSSSNMAIVSLLCWLADARELVRQHGPGCLPKRLIIRFGRARQRELAPSGVTLRTIMLGWLKSHRSPFRVPAEAVASSPASSAFSANMLEASGQDVEAWLTSPTSTPPPLAPEPEQQQQPCRLTVGDALARCLDLFCTPAAVAGREDPEQADAITGDLALEVQCCTAFSAVQHFESHYCLNVTAMGPAYVASHHDLVMSFFKVGAMLRCRRSLLHDAVLVLDRVMSSAVQLRPDMHLTALCAALLLVARQPSPPGLPLTPLSARQRSATHASVAATSAIPPPAVASALSALPGGQGAAAAAMAASWKGKAEGEAGKGGAGASPDKDKESGSEEATPCEASLSRVTGLTESSLRACQSTIRSALSHDTSAISAAHSLHIYLARLGLATNRWEVMRDSDEGSHSSDTHDRPLPPEGQHSQHQQQQQQQQ